MKLSDRVYYRKLHFFFAGKAGTRVMEVYSALLKGRKNLLVDCGVSYDWPDVEQLCLEADLEFKDISAIIHTHNHADHAGADAEIQKRTPHVEIWSHSSGKQWLENKPLQFSIRPVPYFNFLMSDSVKVNRTFEDGEVISDTGYPVEVLYTPGHSTDSASFYLPEDELLISGDTVPNIKFLPFYEDVDAILASMEKCAAKKPRYVLSAFNGLWDMEKDGDIFAIAAERVRVVHNTVCQVMDMGGDLNAAADAVIRALGINAEPNGLFFTSLSAHIEKYKNS